MRVCLETLRQRSWSGNFIPRPDIERQAGHGRARPNFRVQKFNRCTVPALDARAATFALPDRAVMDHQAPVLPLARC
jgi:hypothetical protein